MARHGPPPTLCLRPVADRIERGGDHGLRFEATAGPEAAPVVISRSIPRIATVVFSTASGFSEMLSMAPDQRDVAERDVAEPADVGARRHLGDHAMYRNRSH